VKASDVATGKGQITLEAGRKSETVSITKSVNTGDNANILLYAGLGAVAVIGIIVVVIVKRKNKR
jgi:LPXTG-motif cell wall-anchored protein